MPSSLKHPAYVPMWRGARAAYLIVAVCYFPVAIGGYWAYGDLVRNTLSLCVSLREENVRNSTQHNRCTSKVKSGSQIPEAVTGSRTYGQCSVSFIPVLFLMYTINLRSAKFIGSLFRFPMGNEPLRMRLDIIFRFLLYRISSYLIINACILLTCRCL